MKEYRILIVDENKDQIEEFESFFDTISSLKLDESRSFVIHNLTNLENENELFEYIISNEIDCVAFDYKLMENNSSFSHQGDVYQNQLLEHFEDYPTFIITNNADDYKIMNADPFKIISKKLINFNSDNKEEEKDAFELIKKISQLIDRYNENLIKIEDEFSELINKQKNGVELSEIELNRMIELDSKLENSISKKSKIPRDWKSPSGVDAIVNLVSKSENILNELKKINNAQV
jgi:hypothetical protein